MLHSSVLLHALRCGASLALLAAAPLAALAADPVDLGQQVPESQAIKEGLFPEDTCTELQQAGFKCMGFQPAKKFSLPGANFMLGSAELPDLLRQQLDRFAEVLRTKRGSARMVRIEGHADARGTDEANLALSQKRAEAVKDYLIKNGADQGMLQAVGRGSKELKLANDPLAAENRRVEIGRQGAP